ncbi:MAG: nicotinamidase [Legionella sp. 40-6]|nr:bifunctional nicotinamidase/pyrazinamidase [Legionella sp.]OJY26891.1 MAG: nicotinamidase [Legionella sp. 40-6]
MNALIILDMQNDFISGSLAVPDAETIIPVINELSPNFPLVIATQDWHPHNHQSFASNHNKKPFEQIILPQGTQTLWPDHCVQDSYGAILHAQLDTCAVQAIFRKGMDPKIDSYSAFYDNDHQRTTGLAVYLRAKKATTLYFCGLCADICVYYSIKDALDEGFNCVLIEDATRPINAINFSLIKQELQQLGVQFVSSKEICTKTSHAMSSDLI